MSFQDFQKAPNRLSQRDIGFLIVAALVIALIVYTLAVTNRYLASLWPDGGEFLLLRTGGRSFLIDRIEPYSRNVPDTVQELVYGRAARTGEDVYILDIPFHLLILYFPLALFPDALVARAFWMALLEIALAGFVFLSFRLMDRHIPIIYLGLLTFVAFSSYYAYRSLLEGTPVILLGLSYVGILISLRAGYDELAGALMTFSAFQWEIGGVFLLFVVVWIFWERRWRVFAGAGMLLLVLLIVSFLSYPGWFVPFVRAAWNSLRVGFGFSTHNLLEQLWPQFGSIAGWILTAVLVVTLGYEWRAARGKHFNHFLWVACLTLSLTPLLGQRVELDSLFPLTLPAMLVILVSRERWKLLGDGIALLLLLLYFGLPWLLFTRGVPEWIDLGKEEVIFLFWPVFIALGLYWVRWWMVRPPRTWLDNIPYKGRR